MNPLLTKSYTAGAAVAASRFVKAGAADYKAIQATDGSAAILGVSVPDVPAAVDQKVDVTHFGIQLLELGAAVARGKALTADAVGRGIEAVIVAGTPIYTGGVSLISGVLGDIVPVLVHPAVIANDTGIVRADVTVSSAELLALFATPKQLVAAPGAGKALVPQFAEMFLDYNSAAYAGIAAGEDLAIRYTDATGAIVAEVEATGFLDQTNDEYRYVFPLADAAKEAVANAALVLHMKTGEVITGNSPLKVRLHYRTVDVAW